MHECARGPQGECASNADTTRAGRKTERRGGVTNTRTRRKNIHQETPVIKFSRRRLDTESQYRESMQRVNTEKQWRESTQRADTESHYKESIQRMSSESIFHWETHPSRYLTILRRLDNHCNTSMRLCHRKLYESSRRKPG